MIGKVVSHYRILEKLEDDKNFPKVIRFSPSLPCGKALEKQGATPGDTVVLAQPKGSSQATH